MPIFGQKHYRVGHNSRWYCIILENPKTINDSTKYHWGWIYCSMFSEQGMLLSETTFKRDRVWGCHHGLLWFYKCNCYDKESSSATEMKVFLCILSCCSWVPSVRDHSVQKSFGSSSTCGYVHQTPPIRHFGASYEDSPLWGQIAFFFFMLLLPYQVQIDSCHWVSSTYAQLSPFLNPFIPFNTP